MNFRKFIMMCENIYCVLKSKNYLIGVSRGLLFGRNALIKFSLGQKSVIIPFPLFRSQYKSIFIRKEYALVDVENPRILDIGSNYGMSIIWFKKQWPAAEIVAYEADPEIFKILKKNIIDNELNNVELINKAAWIEDGDLSFSANAMAGGSSLIAAAEGGNQITVSAEDLAKRFDGVVFDLIKVDIEGGEFVLLPYIEDILGRAKYIIFEAHSVRCEKFKLSNILAILERNNFKYHIRTEDDVFNPYLDDISGTFDNRLVIYARNLAYGVM